MSLKRDFFEIGNLGFSKIVPGLFKKKNSLREISQKSHFYLKFESIRGGSFHFKKFSAVAAEQGCQIVLFSKQKFG
jgi:hypothetical protein